MPAREGSRMASLPLLLLGRLRRGSPTPVAAADAPPGLSVVITAHDEEAVIAGCLQSVAAVAAEIVVLDADSGDRTALIADSLGARVVAVTNKPMLEINKNLALAQARHEWVLVLDPDERVSPLLASQIKAVVDDGGGGAAGFWMPRRNYILGRWLRTMGMYPGSQLRLVRRGLGRFSEEDHHLPMSVEGPVDCLTGDLIHHSDRTVAEILRKRTAYAEFAASQMRARGQRFNPIAAAWATLRAFVVPYLLIGGWLEGWRGLTYSALSSYGALRRHLRLRDLERCEGTGSRVQPGRPS